MDADPVTPDSAAAPDETRFGRLGALFGREALACLARARVCVVGLGGVGSWAVEALARSGVGALTLIDADTVSLDNMNRQLPAATETVGHAKAEVLAARVASINPGCRVAPRVGFFTEGNAGHLLPPGGFDWVVDAIDTLSPKCVLIAHCRSCGLPVVTSGGAGGRCDPAQVRVEDLALTHRDQLLRDVRKRLRQRFGFAREEGRPFGVPAVYSQERPMYPQADGTLGPRPPRGGGRPGTAAFVTGVFGLAAASVVVRALAGCMPPGGVAAGRDLMAGRPAPSAEEPPEV